MNSEQPSPFIWERVSTLLPDIRNTELLCITPQLRKVTFLFNLKGFLLLDSGAQYLDGTTDITRTIALGELTEEEKTDYTLILKGHIALAMAKFPVGTRGAQLEFSPVCRSGNME